MLPNILRLENLGGDFSALKKSIWEGRSSAVFYATQNSRYHIVSQLDKFFLYIIPDRISARKAAELLSQYTNGEVVHLPEKEDILVHMQAYVSGGLNERLSALTKLYKREIKGLVISASGLSQYLPSLELFEQSLISLSQNMDIPPHILAEKLVLGGYRKEDMVESSGSFSQRGDIVDIWPINADLPVRVEFFGDMIESLRLFSPPSMISVKEIEEITISPKSDILISQDNKNGILKRLLSIKHNAGQRLQEIVTDLQNKLELNLSHPSFVWLLPFIKENLGTIFDYLPKDTVVVFDEIKGIDDKIRLQANAHKIRVKSFAEAGEATESHFDSIIDRDTILKKAKEHTILAFQQITSSNPVFDPQALYSIKSLPVTKYSANYPALVSDIKSMLISGTKVFIYLGNMDGAKSIQDFLFESGLSSTIAENPDGEEALNKEILLIPQRINGGFIYPREHIMLVGTDDIIRRTERQKKTIRRKKDTFLVPSKGDYVVHDMHGIGISEGVMAVDTISGTRDYYVVLYKGGDKLYLPVDQMDSIEKYTGGGQPALHKLGGKEFERVKERVRKSVKKLAIDLIGLYEKRLKLKGHKYQPDTVWQKEMEDNFEFTETDDQLIATAEIKEDMEKGKVMDRLLCGDVGFGKTEVAIRAIFKTIMEGKQAAILAPTTILCQQHYNTIRTRLSDYGIQIDILSRFVPQKEIKASLERIKSGKTSIVVATHRLLGKDVVFKDLGLLVLDEEQRFGVEHKERIKLLKTNVNVLSLSATPIPRTLHMALSGIRDISVLETPPQNRLPVETYVVEYSDALVVDAVRRELARGGQVFILYNRVQSIVNFYRHIQEILGEEARVSYAHGQMENYELEEKIRNFYNKEADVLVSTTIIENGIDLPDANTLIVIDSDRLGLSELYQLRGRVGRSHHLAYSYFTVREGKVLTENAQKRLDALLTYTELGSGFKIAMQDLEIRGAGNVLGREQHGNMEKVGYDMYCRLLSESIGELQGILPKVNREVEIVVDGEVFLPQSYIPDSTKRVEFYKRIARLSSAKEREELLLETRDIFGALPHSVINLIDVGLIKNLSQQLEIKKVLASSEGLVLHFYDNRLFNDERVFKALDKYKSSALLTPTQPPSIIFDNKGKNTEGRLELLRLFLSESTSRD